MILPHNCVRHEVEEFDLLIRKVIYWLGGILNQKNDLLGKKKNF